MQYVYRKDIKYNENARVTPRARRLVAFDCSFVYLTSGNRCLHGDELLAAQMHDNVPTQYIMVREQDADIVEVTLRGNDVSSNPVGFARAAMNLYRETGCSAVDLYRRTGASMYQLETALWLTRVAPLVIRDAFLAGDIAWQAIGSAARSHDYMEELLSRIAKRIDVSTVASARLIASAIHLPSLASLYDMSVDE